MLRTSKTPAAFTGWLALCAALASASAFADGDCRQWDAPPTLLVKQWGGQDVEFQLQQDGTSFHGWAIYQTTKRWVKGNVSGSIINDSFYARVLWTYSGVNAIGRYSGKIKPRTGVPAGETTYGFVFAGDTYNEYDTANSDYWNAEHFICHVDVPPPQPVGKFDPRVPDAQFAEEKKHNAALAALAAENQPVKAIGRVHLDDAPATALPPTTMSICGAASAATARNSPAAPGLKQQCQALGGALVLDPPLDAATLDALALKGGPIAEADPLSVALRAQQTEGAGQRGFDIGMAAAENQTAPGPGKQHIYNSLGRDEKSGYDAAVSFSLERNRNAELAAKGATIDIADPNVAEARGADESVYYQLGFDIASGIFGDPTLGALGHTATGPGSTKIRDALSADGQRGFNASVAFHLARNYKH